MPEIGPYSTLGKSEKALALELYCLSILTPCLPDNARRHLCCRMNCNTFSHRHEHAGILRSALIDADN